MPATEQRQAGAIAERLAQLQAQNAALRAELEQLRAENQQLRQRLEELERRAGLNSSNSSKPPSSDGPRKPPARRRKTRSLRSKSGKRSGGQPGHKGRTLRQTATPDHTEEHRPQHCGGCGASLAGTGTEGEPVRRQVFDLPPPPPLEATEHRAHACRCPACGELTRAAFPAGVGAPVQYGPRLAATAVYLQNAHFLPEKRLAEVLRDLFGVVVSTATLAGMTHKAAQHWEGFCERVRELIALAAVKHLDETGFRIAGKTQWLHVLGTEWLTFYRTDAKRGSLLQGLAGCVVHDHWGPYWKLRGVLHALCNAHHLRELQALVELAGEDWARRMQVLLKRANRAVRMAREKGIPLPRSLRERMRGRYDRLLEEALAYHRSLEPLQVPKPGRRGRKKRRPGHNLARRLRDRKESVLRFLTDPEVPFTNNLAEQDLRMMKLRMKISGCFRSAQGARDFATLRSVLSTARKQGRNRIEALLHGPEAMLASLRF